EEIWNSDVEAEEQAERGSERPSNDGGNGGDASDGGTSLPEELQLPEAAADRQQFLDGLKYFCRVFPDRFYVDRRGREYLDPGEESSAESEVRLLSAGFHSMMGYFRDDLPLCELLLTEQQRR